MNDGHKQTTGVQQSNMATSSAKTPARKSSLSTDCKACVSYLTRALDRVGSKQQTLLRAMGVVTHRTPSQEKIYQRSHSGRGILIQLEAPSVSSDSALGHLNDAAHANSSSEAFRRRRTRNSIEEQQHSVDKENDATTLRGRLTKAATQIVEGIRHSTVDIINNDSVLSTSPNDQGDNVNLSDESKQLALTTIAIECRQCGSDTRAEAGARAYVKGPDPLSIVLCSNRLSSQREMDEVLIHELMHIYDIRKKRLDLRQCKQLAYSEIRAAREAECGSSFSFTQKICAKDKSIVATKNMFPEEGRSCVCDVFDEAFGDHSPFGPTHKNVRTPLRSSER